MNMKKIEKKLSKLEELKLKNPSVKLDKKIMKLEKKKAKLAKWLKIKLPFRILIKGVAIWLVIGVVCLGCSYVPVAREIKVVAMGAVSYVAPEPVSKVLDVITLNIGANNDDFEWLKNTLNSYLNGEIELGTDYTQTTSANMELSTDYESNSMNSVYNINGNDVTEEEFNQHITESNEKLENIAQDVLGTTSVEEVSSMSIQELLMKVATNATPEIVSQLLDMSNLTEESKQQIEQDVNRALKIIPKLNNNQINELVELVTGKYQDLNKEAENAAKKAEQQMLLEQQKMEEILNELNQQ